ncbi:UNVERIFIED_CONTAM: hypothetical protein HDU68_012374 [Siphonaria sp. JEL0065]|nr:hypothetical protein HDU68_012374 [Siphonaria sp. JEL0065]
MYRSSADVALGTLFGKRNINSASERLRGVATSTGAGLKSPLTTESVFAIEWVENVLRMERHSRAEFLMRELERRAVVRKWSLEREWRSEGHITPRFEAGDIIIAPSKKDDGGGAKQEDKLRRVAETVKTLTRLTEAFKTKTSKGTSSADGGEVLGTPMPVRSKNLMERVFRKPMGSPFATKSSGSGGRLESSKSSSVWGMNPVLPLSLASRWNFSKPVGESESMQDSALDLDKNANVRRLFRKWSTVPAFVEEASAKQSPETIQPAVSSSTLVGEIDLDSSDAQTPEEVPDMTSKNIPTPQKSSKTIFQLPTGIMDWWRKRFEMEGIVKVRRQDLKRQSEFNVSKDADGDFEAEEDGSDTESFECIEPAVVVVRQRLFGWKVKI